MKQTLTINGKAIPLDRDGNLCDLADWNPDVAEALAAQAGIDMTAAHWEIVHLLRQFYQTYALSPAMRPLSKYVRQQLGEEQARSIYLMSLFPGSPARLAAQIAGLPRPANCL